MGGYISRDLLLSNTSAAVPLLPIHSNDNSDVSILIEPENKKKNMIGAGRIDESSAINNMTESERLGAIYSWLLRVTIQVKKSTMYYDMIETTERKEDELGKITTSTVMWMSASHLYLPVILHNVHNGHFGENPTIYAASIVGMPMRGIQRDIVDAIVDLIWKSLLEEGFELFTEDGVIIDYEKPVYVSAQQQQPETYVPPLPLLPEQQQSADTFEQQSIQRKRTPTQTILAVPSYQASQLQLLNMPLGSSSSNNNNNNKGIKAE